MIPSLVIPPAGPLVGIADLKAHLRIDFDDDDALIVSLEKAAVAHLDGWRGILRRCIQAQTWEISFDQAGCHRLPFEDVTSIEVSGGMAKLSRDARGSFVTLSEATTVTMIVQSPADVQEIAAIAVKMLVEDWYDASRKGAASGPMATVPLTVDRLLAPVRAVRI